MAWMLLAMVSLYPGTERKHDGTKEIRVYSKNNRERGKNRMGGRERGRGRGGGGGGGGDWCRKREKKSALAERECGSAKYFGTGAWKGGRRCSQTIGMKKSPEGAGLCCKLYRWVAR